MAFSKKQKQKKTYEQTHELINMNHTSIPIITLCEPQISKGFEGEVYDTLKHLVHEDREKGKKNLTKSSTNRD